MSAANPTIYVDIVRDEPKTLEKFSADWLTGRLGSGDEDADLATAYRRYRDRFQPFRVAVKSGDNQEPLFRSTESYFNEADARHAAEIAFGDQSNVFLRRAEHGNETLRLANTGGGA